MSPCPSGFPGVKLTGPVLRETSRVRGEKMIQFVKKRDGRVVPFDPEKIAR
ncbi:hypothetical protein DRJ58_06140, partial [Candidatus Acetothermia bacterium]